MTSRVYNLAAENELRFVVFEEKSVSIELLSGFAEISGSELLRNTVYTFQPFKIISLFSWQGCKVKLTGKVFNPCIKTDSLIMISVNIHACLEEQRIIAECSSVKGPVCLVVGGAQSGKSAFCHFLLNYAVRMGRKPLYIDLDVFQNRSSVPGTVSIFPVEKPSDISEGFSKHSSSVYLFGYAHPRENTKLYFLLVKQLAKMVKKRLSKENPEMYYSGAIIDAFSWVRKKGYVTIVLAVRVFEPSVVFVLSKKDLFNRLKYDMPSNVKVVFVPRQKGIFNFKASQQAHIRANLFWRYFYGSIRVPLTPYTFDVAFSDIQIYSAARYSNAHMTFDVLCNVVVKDVKFVNLPITPDLVNSILGLSYADKPDENILVENVKGFICVVGVNMKKEVITVLSPQPAPMQSKIFILSSMKFKKEDCTMLE